MRIDYRQALTYPFRRENRLNCLVIPALLSLVYTVLSAFLDSLDMAAITRSLSKPVADLLVEENVKFFVLQLFFAFLSGYNWHLTKSFQERGLDAPAPSWTGMLTYWVDGLKLLLFFIVLFIPFYGFNLYAQGIFNEPNNLLYALSILGLALGLFGGYFLLSPLFGTMYITSAPTRRLKDLFNVVRSWPIAFRNYWRILLVKLLFYIVTFVSLSLLIVAQQMTSLPDLFELVLTFIISYLNSSMIMVSFSHVLTQIIVAEAGSRATEALGAKAPDADSNSAA